MNHNESEERQALKAKVKKNLAKLKKARVAYTSANSTTSNWY